MTIITRNQLQKMSTRYMAPLDVIQFLKKKYPNVKVNKKKLFAMQSGDLLMAYKNTRGNWTKIIIQNIFIKSFSKIYSITQKRPKGKELLIANFRLPSGPVIEKNETDS